MLTVKIISEKEEECRIDIFNRGRADGIYQFVVDYYDFRLRKHKQTTFNQSSDTGNLRLLKNAIKALKGGKNERRTKQARKSSD